MPLDIAALTAPFPPERVSWRVGSTNKEKTKGMALAYIDARDVMARLDEVCGVLGWECEYSAIGAKTCCSIGIYDFYHFVSKADGAGDTDFEGEKGVFSDAFKRAAVKWGIGRYLYNLKAPWVAIEQKGRSYVIAKRELAGLQRLLSGPTAKTAKPPLKNAPGVMKAKQWISEHIHDLGGSEDGEHFISQIETAKGHWVRICRDYPGVWEGPENTGLRADGARFAATYNVRSGYDAFIELVSGLAADTKEAA